MTLALIAPVASATWYGPGTFEPDTPQDKADGFTWLDAHVGAAEKVYFNAYQTTYLTGTNPNAGVAESRVGTAMNHWNAIFGVWKDCNGDGYVGHAEMALRDYRVELLLDASVCTAGTLHNDGEWVFEYIPVGPISDAEGNTHSPILIDDQDARIWGDLGLPGEKGARTCPLAPPPHGTTSGTGAFIRFVDCRVGGNIVETINTVDSDGSLGLRFDDPNNPQQSDSLLNQHFPVNLFGNPETGKTGFLQLDSEEDGGNEERAFTAWDCSQRSVDLRDPTAASGQRGSLSQVVVADPTGGQLRAVFGDDGEIRENLTGEDGSYAWFAKPAPAAHDPTNSYADGLNQTFRGFNVGAGAEEGYHGTGGTCKEEGTDSSGDNTYSDYHQFAFFYADGDHEGNAQAPGKRQTDVDFNFFDGATTSARDRELFGEGTPRHLGLGGFGQWWYGPGWDAGVVYSTPPYAAGRAEAPFTHAYFWSFYAYVGDTTTAAGYLTPGSTGTYGSEACTSGIGPGAGIQNGWVCDPNEWYLDPTGRDISSRWDVRVGHSYQLRDIDCLDGQLVGGIPVYASLAGLTSPCPGVS